MLSEVEMAQYREDMKYLDECCKILKCERKDLANKIGWLVTDIRELHDELKLQENELSTKY